MNIQLAVVNFWQPGGTTAFSHYTAELERTKL
jgi:hypothetical protein